MLRIPTCVENDFEVSFWFDCLSIYKSNVTLSLSVIVKHVFCEKKTYCKIQKILDHICIIKIKREKLTFVRLFQTGCTAYCY